MIPVEKIDPAPGTEYFLNLRVFRSDEWNSVPEDHVYATAQFKLPVEGQTGSCKTVTTWLCFRQRLSAINLKSAGRDMKIVFNLETGRMESYNL